MQIAQHFFTRADGNVGQWAAYRRLRKLEEMGLVRQDRTFWREANVVRLTGAGARLADIDIGPARLVLAEVRHTLALVDLVEALLANSAKGTSVETERELRIGRRRDLARGTRPPGKGRVPDALFTTAAGKKLALELDTTPKRVRDLDNILVAYIQERYDGIVWYVLPRQIEQLEEVVRRQRADDFVEVRAWHGPTTTGKVG